MFMHAFCTMTYFKFVLQYCVESHIRLHGYDPADSMILMKPREVSIYIVLFVLYGQYWVSFYEKQGTPFSVRSMPV